MRERHMYLFFDVHRHMLKIYFAIWVNAAFSLRLNLGLETKIFQTENNMYFKDNNKNNNDRVLTQEFICIWMRGAIKKTAARE